MSKHTFWVVTTVAAGDNEPITLSVAYATADAAKSAMDDEAQSQWEGHDADNADDPTYVEWTEVATGNWEGWCEDVGMGYYVTRVTTC